MKKQMRLVLIAGMIAILALTVLSFTVFAADDATDLVTPVNGVYTVENADQLIYVFKNLGTASVSATSTIKLANDIDVDGKLTTVQRVFSGVLDGNGKTISGITAPLFTQFKGTVKNLTLRAKDGVTLDTASIAMKAFDATASGVVSYINVQAKEQDTYAAGLFAYAEGKVTVTNCSYYGELKAEAKQGDLAVGGIVGGINPNGQKVTANGNLFGGKVTVAGGVDGKKIMVGGILGQIMQGSVIANDNASVGTLTSAITAGTDYVGGIIGLNESSQLSLEHCANKGDITAVKNAGGIFGGITVASKVMACTNLGKLTGEKIGAFCGNGKGVNLSCFGSYDFAEGSQAFCGTDFTPNGSYTVKELNLEKTFTLGNKEYDQYDRCTIDKTTGLTVVPLQTTKMFEAFVSTRNDGDTQALRFVILSNETCEAASVTVSVKFLDFGGNVIKSYTGILGGKDNNLALYKSVAAAGENYFATEGCAIFGCVITDVPVGMWSKVQLTVTDTADGTVYLSPVSMNGSKEALTIESLPDLSSLGKVSAVYNCGPGLASDQYGVTAEDSYMKVISETSKEKFEAYVETLSKSGFAFVGKTTSDGDDYYSFSKFGKLIYLYYSHRVNEIRVIVDNSSDALSKISYDYEAKEGERAEFYQYSINYSRVSQKGFDPVEYKEGEGLNCGMMYILKTADNKIIMIDGGHSTQMSTQAKKFLMSFLREITGTPENEKVTIATWFITHAHGDHVAVARDMLSEYKDQIELESVIFNIPSYQVINNEYDANTFTLKTTISKFYPKALYHKLHTGEEFSIGGIGIEVLYTHEDAVDPEGNTEIINDYNSTSTCLRFNIDGKTFTILGDLNTTGQNAIVQIRSAEYMKSDLMQAAHHGYNHIGEVYKLISAEIVVFPQSMLIAKGECVHQFKAATVNAKEYYFAHKWIYRFVVEDGVIKSTAIPRYDQR